MAIAREFCSRKRNIRFDVASIESLSSSHGASRFTAAVANMTFVNCRDLLICLQSVKMALKPHGSLVMTVTHPCFWPRYWDYEGEAWFDYRAELMIEAPFQTSLCKCEQTTTHIHRSLECYFDCFQKAGLYVEHLVEPFPNRRALKHYPTRWSFPRFLGFRLKRLQ